MNLAQWRRWGDRKYGPPPGARKSGGPLPGPRAKASVVYPVPLIR